MAKPRQDRHSAKVTVNESFDLGKNTAKNSGIEIEIFDKGTGDKRGSKLGTLRIGQGSVRWWTKNARTTKPTKQFRWKQFADKMDESSN